MRGAGGNERGIERARRFLIGASRGGGGGGSVVTPYCHNEQLAPFRAATRRPVRARCLVLIVLDHCSKQLGVETNESTFCSATGMYSWKLMGLYKMALTRSVREISNVSLS